MRIRTVLVILLCSPILCGRPAMAQSDLRAIGEVEAGRLGAYKSGGASRGTARMDLDAVKGAADDPLIGSKTAVVLGNVKPDRTMRGAKEEQIYKRHSRSVVLVVTKDGLGSGALINAKGDIVTNWHVVEGYSAVGVIFKPAVEGKQVTETDLRRATVVRVDEVADLALIRVDAVPAGVAPMPLGQMSEVSVGSDVHAIGHPTGEAWTYTKGVISQMRQNYEWSSDTTRGSHRANVIQTQTPISPGNSGGPLISSNGRLVGINSFKAMGEGLNFAIAVDEVRRFLATTHDRLAEQRAPAERQSVADGCKPQELYRGPSEDDTNEVLGIDLDCDGKADAELRTPYDIRKPITFVMDKNKDGQPDTITIDTNRDGKWDYSLYDTNFDGKWDLVGYHSAGGLEPTRVEAYKE